MVHQDQESSPSEMEELRQRCSHDGWHEEGLHSFCSRIMLHAGFVTLFGHNKSLSSTTMKNARDDFQTFDDAFSKVMAGIPLWLLRGAFKARVALEQRFLPENVATLSEPSALIAERIAIFNRCKFLSEVQKARAHLSVLWAAHANTLPLAFWVLFYLLRSPEAQEAVRPEVEELCGGDLDLSETRIPLDQKQLNGLVNLSSAVKETLRLVSSAMHVRVVKQNFNLDLGSGQTYAIRHGDMLAMVPEMTYMDPEIYANPEEFHHDCYIDEFGKERTSFQYRGRELKHFLMPFGSGSSMCPGRFFALNEIRQMMVLLFCHLDMELIHPEDPPPKSRGYIGIQPPREDVLFRFRCKVELLSQ
uniref:cytochrome P450 7A1-like n=1 Tax=Myxine glutinosa TaxID=7769 RepID=UPI00358F2663